MLKSLYKSEKVIKELSKFERRISLIKDEDIRKSAKKILLDLREKIQDLDSGHRSHLLGEVRPSLMIHTKDEITNLRKSLDTLISENT